MRPSKRDLCKRHSRLYIYDAKNEVLRKKKRLSKGVRRHEDHKKYHMTERKLHEILKFIYGKDKVIASVHPVTAKSPRGALLEFDFAIPHKRLYIEYNGMQHYEYPNYFHSTEEEFKEQQTRDRMKETFAIRNDWSLIVIDYHMLVNYEVIYELLNKNKVL
jgi:hypothetical protein